MSVVDDFREFVNQRLTAAAEEIFRVYEKTVVDYEKEIERQRRLLDVVWKPVVKLHRLELPQQHVCKEEEEEKVLTDQQLCIQERNSSLDQEDPEPPQIKEQQESTSEEREQLVLKQETDAVLLTLTCEESDHSEGQTLNLSIGETLSAVEEKTLIYITVESSVVSEQNSDQQLLSHNSQEAESQDQKGGKPGDSGSSRDAEPQQQKQHHTSSSHTNSQPNPYLAAPSVKVGQIEPTINQGTQNTTQAGSLNSQPYSQGQNNNVPVFHIPEGQQPVGYINGLPVYLKAEAFAPPATTSKSKKRKCHGTEQDRTYVKKPLNAFMLYMKEQRPKYVAEMKVTGTAQVNKALGEKWKLLSDVEKAKYYEEAKKQQCQHEEQHPDWSAQANYGKKRKRDRRKAAKVAVGQTYEDVPQPDKKPHSVSSAGTASSAMDSHEQ